MIPYGRQKIDEDDIAAVTEVLRQDFLTTGPKVEEFENALSKLTTAKHVISCSSATTALHLASMSLGLGPGDAVIVPSITFLATANSIRYTGADVIFCDVDPDTGLMTKENLEDSLSRANQNKIKAVYPVHLTGQCVDLSAIRKVADKNDLKIVADSCHAIGGLVNGHPVGACHYEDISTFSFHPVKTIASGEGGCVITNDDHLAEHIKKLRSHGMQPNPEEGPWAYTMDELGYNYRITDIQCALGLSQLQKLGEFAKRRREIVKRYDELLLGINNLETVKTLSHSDAVRHLYSVLIDFDQAGISRAEFMLKLREKGIGSQVHYIPVHKQPYYEKLYGNLKLPGAEQYYRKTLSLPLYPGLTDEDINKVVASVKELLGG